MTENNFLTKTLTDTVLTRRSFLKWSAAVGGSAALAGGLNFGLKTVEAAGAMESKWIPVACWHNCGGRCLLKAEVRDGIVTRVKTDDTHEDTPDFPQQRGCVRGRSQRKQVFGADRLKYPMKRKNWEPGGGKKELRGKDEWVRISWEEALDIIASETKRITSAYGNESIYSVGPGEINRTLALAGGYATGWGMTSWGTWTDTPAIVGSYKVSYSSTGNDRLRLRKSKLIIMWGANPAISSNGSPTYNYMKAKKSGAKFIFVDPMYSDSASILADEWIPIRPATDLAMLLGMAYVMIKEDNPITNSLIDWNFLDNYVSGFDRDHMPEGTDPKDNFKDYVLGTYDGVAKTPEWASQICGTPPEKIRALAIEYAITKPTMVICGGASTRIHNGSSTSQGFITLACMTGNIGVPGAGVGLSCHNRAGNAGPSLVNAGGSGIPGVKNPISVKINYNQAWEAVLEGKYIAAKDDVRDVNIQMIYHGGYITANQCTGLVKGIEAHRKVEFVVTQGHFFNTDARYSDIVLPITTMWERYGTFTSGNREALFFSSQATEPLFEAKDDMWVAVELAKLLGVDPMEVEPFPIKQQTFNQLAGAKVITKDGSGYEPLVTITKDDIAEMGVEGEPQSGRISYKEFQEKGVYQVPRSENDKFGFTEFEDYRKDPETYKRETPSGKIEIYCQAYADKVTGYGFSVKHPLPTYDRVVEGYEDTFANWEKKVKGDFPLQLYTIHYQRRSHSIFNNIPWLREFFPQEFVMNPMDAKKRGLKEADLVLITSRHGKVLRRAHVTERMIPGVVTLGEGAWVEMDEQSGIDLAGATNILNGGIYTDQGNLGFNSCNVQVEKYTGPLQLEPDHVWPQRIIFKEAQK
ncbi:MAG: molybdopterin-dependent oxidoreductase [Anaerolineales bacterium]